VIPQRQKTDLKSESRHAASAPEIQEIPHGPTRRNPHPGRFAPCVQPGRDAPGNLSRQWATRHCTVDAEAFSRFAEAFA